MRACVRACVPGGDVYYTNINTTYKDGTEIGQRDVVYAAYDGRRLADCGVCVAAGDDGELPVRAVVLPAPDERLVGVVRRVPFAARDSRVPVSEQSSSVRVS